MNLFPLMLLLPREDFAPVWAKVEATIRQSYYARDKRHDEMERRLAECAPIAKAAKNREEFDAAIGAMAAGFGDSHFDFLTDEEPNYYVMDGLMKGEAAAEMPSIGAWFAKNADDGYTVTMILDGGVAEAAGLRKGDVILRVDEMRFSPVVALRPLEGQTAKLTYRRAGVEAEASVAVKKARPVAAFLDATRQSERIVTRDGKRYGVIHLWTQIGTPFSGELATALKGKFKDTDGLILDLRGGFGGSPVGFVELFQGASAIYQKPLVVVIDHGSRSAKELTAYRLHETGRAILVGETTAGHVLATWPTHVAPWAYLELPVSEVPVGKVRLEKVGVSPDIPVAPNEDPIERALGVLEAKRV